MQKYILIASIALIFGCKQNPASNADATLEPVEVNTVSLTPEQLKNAGIEIGNFEKKILSDELVLNGTVDVPPQNIVSVSFPLGGYLKSTSLLPGKQVTKGEVIGIIEDQSLVQLQQEYLVGAEKLKYLELEYQRQKELNENNVNAAKIYQQALADYNSQKVILKAIGEKLRLISINPDKLNADNLSRSVPIYSPINGFVSRVQVNIGKYVQPADVLFELIDPGDIHASITVFQKDVSKLAIGQEVEVNFINDQSKKYKAKVFLITRNLDENRTETIHCHFLDRPKDLAPGMFLQSRLKTSPREVLAIPESGVVNYLGKQYVFVSTQPGKYEMVEAETGVKEAGYLEIKNADQVKGMLVTKNAYSVLGALVNTGGEDH